MIFALLNNFITLVLDIFATVGIAADEKDLEIALLRQQLRILERKGAGKHRLALPEKLMLVALVSQLKEKGHTLHERLRTCLILVQPETLLK